jgi:hypothetical protein
MTSIVRRVCAIVFLVLGSAFSSVFGQPPPNPALWNVVNNPSGQRIVPVVYYNPATAILSVDTRGLDGVADTAANTGAIADDDVGLITFLVTGPSATALPPFNGGFDNGIAWVSQYFAGKMQTIGTAVLGQYLAPGVKDFFQYPAGTPAAALDGAVVEMAVNFAPNSPGNVLNGRVQIHVTDGDFNNDGLYNCLDINALSSAVATQGSQTSFDLNGDGVLSILDLDAWRSEAGAENLGPGRSYLPGDANLNGAVDGADFIVWNSAKFTTNTNWCNGNFTGDSVIDVSDFGIWNSNKFTASDSLVVPEPALDFILIAYTLGLVRLRRGWSSTYLPIAV